MRSVSIIICTRDRADSLRQTLYSIGKCEVPADLLVEVIALDNGSTDGTATVVRETSMSNGLSVKNQLERTPGLSRARNAALRHSTGEVLLFTDDDVRVPPGWIGGMCDPILSGAADAVAGGVHLPPEYESELASGLFRSRRGWLASTESTAPDDPRCLVGANMAFTRRAAEAVGGFDPELGAGALGFCEETLFAAQLQAAGFKLRTAFGVSVAHYFDLSRLTRKTLVDMAARMGRSAAYVDYHWERADVSAARMQLRRAAVLLLLERLRALWRRSTVDASLQETQRIHTHAYWLKLVELSRGPRRYRSAVAADSA